MPIAVSDNQDGTGLNVTVSGVDPAAMATVQVQDTALPDYRNTVSRIGNGVVHVAVGEGLDQITLTRSYWVRASIVVGAVETFTQSYLVTATQDYKSDIFALIIAAKHKLIRADIKLIRGKVFHCIDPDGVISTVGELPALFIHQSEGEPSIPQDNRTRALVAPIRVTMGSPERADWIASLQHWLYVRQRIGELFDGQSTDDEYAQTGGGRRWRVRYDRVVPDNPSDYQYRATAVTLLTDIERRIGGN